MCRVAAIIVAALAYGAGGLLLLTTSASAQTHGGIETWWRLEDPDDIRVVRYPSSLGSGITASIADYDANTNLTISDNSGGSWSVYDTNVYVDQTTDWRNTAAAWTMAARGPDSCLKRYIVSGGGGLFYYALLRNEYPGSGTYKCDTGDRPANAVRIYFNRATMGTLRCLAGVGEDCIQAIMAHELHHGVGFSGHTCSMARIVKGPDCVDTMRSTLTGLDISAINSLYP